MNSEGLAHLRGISHQSVGAPGTSSSSAMSVGLGGHGSPSKASLTGAILHAVTLDIRLRPPGATFIVGDLNADIPDLPRAQKLISDENRCDLGAIADQWGQPPDQASRAAAKTRIFDEETLKTLSDCQQAFLRKRDISYANISISERCYRSVERSMLRF